MTDRPADSLPFAADEGASAEQRAGEYVVVARRYRPQTFDELIGQEHVAQALRGAISSQRVGHAYLFTGARGVGKTSAARILANAQRVVAAELLCAAQGLELLLPLRPGRGVGRLHRALSRLDPPVLPLGADRPPAPDLERLAAAIRRGDLDPGEAR